MPLCIGICGICGYIWLRLLSQPETSVTVYYEFGVWSILVSCVIELCCEQLYIVAQAFLFVKLQVTTIVLYVYSLQLQYEKKRYFQGFIANKMFFLFSYLIVNKTEQVLGCIRNNKRCRPYDSLHYGSVVLGW